MGGKKMSHEPVKEIRVPKDKKQKLKYYLKEKKDIEGKIADLEKEAATEKVEADEEAEVKATDDAAKKKALEESEDKQKAEAEAIAKKAAEAKAKKR